MRFVFSWSWIEGYYRALAQCTQALDLIPNPTENKQTDEQTNPDPNASVSKCADVL